MGSVKDLVVMEKPSKGETGSAYFEFSDRYSVFDWGEMPDHLSKKGAVLAMMGGYNFEMLEAEGIPTHYQGMIEDDSEKKLEELRRPSNKMKFELVEKPKVRFKSGEYEYEDLSDKKIYFIPLEVVFRNSIPIGSSIRRRYTPEELGLNFEEWLNETIELKDPIVEFSTKMEEKDRYISEKEAQEISGLDDGEFKTLKKRTRRVNDLITKRAKSKGFKHLDGKVEYIYHKGEIKLADVTGTFDENRFSFNGFQVSKEVIRQWYKENDSEWYESVKKAKEEAEEKGIKKWKSLVNKRPRKLEPRFLRLIEELYKAGGNRWMGRDWFDAPALDKVTRDLKEILS